MIATDEHFLELSKEIKTYCRNLTKDYHKANDLYQEVYIDFNLSLLKKEFINLKHLFALIRKSIYWIFCNNLKNKTNNKYYIPITTNEDDIGIFNWEPGFLNNVYTKDILKIIEKYPDKKAGTYLILFIEGYQMKEIAKMYNDNVDYVQYKINILRKLLLTNKYISYRHKVFKQLNKINLNKLNRSILVFQKDNLDKPIGKYKTLKDIIKDYPQLNPQEISRILNNRSFSAKGYTFKYTRQL